MEIKSEKGFTLQDLVVAIIVITTLVGTVGSIMINAYKLNLETTITAKATNYAIQIMEDIDKIPYDSVDETLATTYSEKFSIPSSYIISLHVENYNDNNSKEDLIKKVKLTISYQMENEKEEKIVINKLKIREINL